MDPDSSPRSEVEQRDDMAEEATRIEYWARTWDESYRRLAHSWALFNTFLVVSAAILAAFAGATTLSKLLGTTAAGLIALAAAVVSGTAGALGASTRATQYNSAAAANSGLADAARLFQIAVVADLPLAEVREQFDVLCKRRDTVVTSAPVSGKPKKAGQPLLAAWPPQVTPPRRPGSLALGAEQATSQQNADEH
jgi:hypothetical protein